ncbi:Zinc/iron permease [Trametes gibbosa]|nr:Zinc/iron permease [Trametes gibbosa]
MSMLAGLKSRGKLPGTAPLEEAEDADLATRVLIMLVIFFVSLAAVSFPTITETYRSIRVPSVFFFVGKHFGTGVILSTAFVHLLQDAFKALQDPEVNARWRVEQWAGMIVLGSLLSIFLVEYVSTAFVDRLQSYPSAPSSPTISPHASSAPSLHMDCEAAAELPPPARPSILVQSPKGSKAWVSTQSVAHRHKHGPSHSMHQVGDFVEGAHPSAVPVPLAPPELASEATDGIDVYADENTPLTDSANFPPPLTDASYGTARSVARPSARPSARNTHASAGDTFFSGGHHRHETRDSHSMHHARASRWAWFSFLWPNGDDASPLDAATITRLPSTHSLNAERRGTMRSQAGRSFRESQHGHVHASDGQEHEGRGHGHTHLDMEQWMNGVDDGRHDVLHDSPIDEECDSDLGDEELKIGRRRQVIGILVLQMGIMIHSLVIGLTLSIASGPEFASLVIAIGFHQLFEGLSLGIRIAGLPSKHSEDGFKHLSGRTLKPLLAVTFAITTPFGIGLGLAALSGAASTGPRLTLIQGVMSAISAGMLIYAACVEMLAGDFVMDAHLWRSSLGRQVLALASLFAGAAAMAAIGFLD